ncbi:MAG: hypothetical protein LBF87_08930 [Treponema sp.]|jgi:hypothetical protein|nr:hypothetical protein [Treponema sp.]
MMELKNELFDIEAEGALLKNLKHPDDPYTMNWVEGAVLWGSVMTPKSLSVNVTRDFTSAGTLRESYVFTNASAFPVFTCLGDIGIHTPFNDSYHEAARKVAEASIRGALGLFMPDGSAACARLYPLKVNGEWASCLDPWANDQDWALFFALD